MSALSHSCEMPANGFKTVVLCNSEPVMAEGIRTLLADCQDLKFQQATESLKLAAEILHRTHPSILLLDRLFGPQAILDWLASLKADPNSDPFASTGIVIWGASGAEPESVRFLRAGVRGFLRKTADIPTTLACLRAVASGRTWMEEFRSDKHLEPTLREREVLELIERGFKNKEIARELGISEGTVKIHVMHLFRKTGLTRHALALRSLRDHLGQPAPADFSGHASRQTDNEYDALRNEGSD